MTLWVAAGVSLLVGLALLRGAHDRDPVTTTRRTDDKPRRRLFAGGGSFVNDDTRVPLMVLGVMVVALALGWAYQHPDTTPGMFLHTTINRVSQATEVSK